MEQVNVAREFLKISTSWAVTDFKGVRRVVLYVLYVFYYHLIRNEPRCIPCV